MKHCTLHRALLVTSFIVVTGFALDAAAKTAPPTACVSPIANCGCTITKGGSYTLGPGPFNMTGVTTTDCIDISGAKVNLLTNGVAITGGGNGVGINILKSATSANVQLADPSNPTVPSAISNFTNGIEVQGSGVIVNNFNVSNNTGDGLLIKGATNCSVMNFTSNNGTANGVTIDGGSACQIYNFNAGGNTGFGLALINAKSEVLSNFGIDDFIVGQNVLGGISLTSSSSNTLLGFDADDSVGNGVTLTNSSKNVIGSFDASGNGGAGVALSGSSSNAIFDVSDTDDNATYGIWLNASNSNSIRSAVALGNTQAGIYLGCSPTMPGANDCAPRAKPSSKNTVTAIQAGNDTVPVPNLPQLFGVAVDLGDLQNNLSGITATGDTTDLQDLNVSCGTNVWFANAGASLNPTCAP